MIKILHLLDRRSAEADVGVTSKQLFEVQTASFFILGLSLQGPNDANTAISRSLLTQFKLRKQNDGVSTK